VPCFNVQNDIFVGLINWNYVLYNGNLKECHKCQLHSGRAMAQAVSRRPLTTEARGSVPGQVHVRFVVDKVALGQIFLRDVGFPLSTGAPLIVKIGKTLLIFIIIGVAQKALRLWCEGPSSKKKKQTLKVQHC
jgi:hypothetical protein